VPDHGACNLPLGTLTTILKTAEIPPELWHD
jgi:hypothetical protein